MVMPVTSGRRRESMLAPSIRVLELGQLNMSDTGADRNTVRRIVRIANNEGIGRETLWPDEGKLQAIRQCMGRPDHAASPEVYSDLQLGSSRVRRLLLSFNSADTSRL